LTFLLISMLQYCRFEYTYRLQLHGIS
jgi:hypothetical protein